MATTTGTKVTAVDVIDPRIDPQPPPVYASTIGPQQNQFYKIPASGLSNSYITFNNLTTLGADRAYLDTFELEITANITFILNSEYAQKMALETNPFTGNPAVENWGLKVQSPARDLWTFESFPFNKCCEETRVNVNGGAFFSSPLSYVRAKERYWDEKKINDAYGCVCPCNKPWAANEVGGTNRQPALVSKAHAHSRCWGYNMGYAENADTMTGSQNNDFVPIQANKAVYGLVNTANVTFPETYTVTWREPIFCSPFSSRIDETYGRPLYNITSIDIAFNMQSLKNMIRCVSGGVFDYNITLQTVNLCYQVMTLPPRIGRPVSTVIPYRRFVPYITDSSKNASADGAVPTGAPYYPKADGEPIVDTIESGVYTLNEVPTAIWLFVAPTKALVQGDLDDRFLNIADMDDISRNYVLSGGMPYHPSSYTWGFNKSFCQIDNISISCANTTQILNTATPYDLFRICKANGLQDSFTEFNRDSFNILPDGGFQSGQAAPGNDTIWTSAKKSRCTPIGSVIRLIPGTDIVIPDQQLIPGANANNMVFKASVTFRLPDGWPLNYRKLALWLLFEYVGVATLTPGQCQIEMNPLGNGISSMEPIPTIKAAAIDGSTSTIEGSGWMDVLKQILAKANEAAKQSKVLSRLARKIPYIGDLAGDFVKHMGYGAPAAKRAASAAASGGAIMGYGDFC